MSRRSTETPRHVGERGQRQPAWAPQTGDAGISPSADALAELESQLLAEPPAINVAAAGGFAADRRQAKVRWLLLSSGLAVLAALVGGWLLLYRSHEWARLHPYSLPAGTDTSDRPREIHWSSGKARLGLQRDAPAANVIVLPDRELHLAEGCDHAQVYVEVVDDRTVEVDVLIGDIVQRERAPE
jgi:hypothetical protein